MSEGVSNLTLQASVTPDPWRRRRIRFERALRKVSVMMEGIILRRDTACEFW